MRTRHLTSTPGPALLPTELRVLYLIDSLRPGGAEQLMATWLPRVRDLGVTPVVAAMQVREGNPLAEPLRRAGIEVRVLGIERLRQRDAVDRVRNEVERAQPDLLHAQLEFSTILGTRVARSKGIPTVATIHTIEQPRPFTRDGLRERLMHRALRTRTDRVIAVSKRARDHIVATASLPRNRVIALWNGIDLAPFRTPSVGRGDIRAELGIPVKAPLIVTVAVLRQPKGVQDMIEAMSQIGDRLPNAHYLVVGDGAHRAELEALVGRLDLADRVLFSGRRDDVADLLGASDVFALPSHTEALPTVVIEAMAAGLPVVATDVGGIPEMVERGGTALLVPPHRPDALADAVGRLIASPRQATAMGRAGARLAAERFDVRRHAAFLVDEYRHLAARRERT